MSLLNAQTVSFKDIKFKAKKGYMNVDDVKWFDLRWEAGYAYVLDTETGEEVMYIYFDNNETSSYIDDDFVKVYFSKSGKVLESKSHHKVIIANLINNKVITDSYKIDEAKIDAFIQKYDENISNRTIR